MSIWSREHVDDEDDLHSGGRALAAVVRPYAARVAGVPVRMSYDTYNSSKPFELTYCPHVDSNDVVESSTSAQWLCDCCHGRKRVDVPADSARTSVIFVPSYVYDDERLAIEVSAGSHYRFDQDNQALYVTTPVAKNRVDGENSFVRLKIK